MPYGKHPADGRGGRGSPIPRRRIEDGPAEQPPAVDDEIVRPEGDGDELPPDPFDLTGLPEGRAMLRIVTKAPVDGKPRFGFELRCCCTDDVIVSGKSFGLPDLDPSINIAAGGTLPREFLIRMKGWSAKRQELARPLYDLRCAHEQLELVIWDDMRTGIQWELLWLPPWPGKPEPAPGFLGAVVTVTRWTDTDAAFPEVMRSFTNEVPYQGRGPVVAYIDEEMESDHDMLNGYFVVNRMASMNELVDNLDIEAGALLMVYVAAHGTFSNEPEHFVLGDFSYSDFAWYDSLRRLVNRDTLVFLNSCVSGLQGFDVGKYNDGALRGFAEVFLRSGAAGVLATTGAIGTNEARLLADDLFNRLTTDPNLSVAEGVRQLRTELQDLVLGNRKWFLSNASEDDVSTANTTLLSPLYPFMYVYFGSPRLMFAPEQPPRADTGRETGG